MSGLRSGAVILLLAVPFALYAAWQVRAVTRAGAGGPSPPAEKGLPDADQIAAAKARAEKWAAEVRGAGAVALQYRRSEPRDGVIAGEVAEAAAARATDLADLETFLAEKESPEYAGALKGQYPRWDEGRRKLREAADAVENWLGDGFPAVGGEADAEAALKKFNGLLEAYTANPSPFKSKRLVAGWRVRARARVVAALAAAAAEPYAAALTQSLPIPPDQPELKTARAALREVKGQLGQIEKVAAQAKVDGLSLPGDAEEERARAAAAARDCAAREELLALFADPELFTDPDKAADWFPKVQAQFDKTQGDADRAVIRKKVQEFCAAYAPAAARLDAVVLVRDAEVSRSGVTVVYASDAGDQGLTDSTAADGVTEFNFQTRHPNLRNVEWKDQRGKSGTSGPSGLKPTPRSVVARDYTAARAGVTAWNRDAVDRLKKACEGDGAPVEQQKRRELADELVGVPPPGAGAGQQKVWTRLAALARAADTFPKLFEAGR